MLYQCLNDDVLISYVYDTGHGLMLRPHESGAETHSQVTGLHEVPWWHASTARDKTKQKEWTQWIQTRMREGEEERRRGGVEGGVEEGRERKRERGSDTNFLKWDIRRTNICWLTSGSCWTKSLIPSILLSTSLHSTKKKKKKHDKYNTLRGQILTQRHMVITTQYRLLLEASINIGWRWKVIRGSPNCLLRKEKEKRRNGGA